MSKEKKVSKISVRATDDGFAGGVRRRAGEVFFIDPDVKGRWFEPVDPEVADKLKLVAEEEALAKAEADQEAIDVKIAADQNADKAKKKADIDAKKKKLAAQDKAKTARAKASDAAEKKANKEASASAKASEKSKGKTKDGSDAPADNGDDLA